MKRPDPHWLASIGAAGHRGTRTLGLASVVALALLAAACGTQTTGDSGSGTGPVQIAFEGPMTGAAGVYGQDQFKGMELAVDEINAAGGVTAGPEKGRKLKISSYDNAADTAQAAAVAQKLCGDKNIPVVLGDTLSSSTLTELPIFTRCGMPVIDSYSSNPTMDGKKYPTFFRTILSDADNGKLMAQFAIKDLGMTKIGTIVAPNDYGSGLQKAFSAAAADLGSPVVTSVTTSPGQKDFSSTLTKLKGAGVNGVVMLNEYQDQGLQLKQMLQMGWKVPVLTSTGGNTPALVELAGKEATQGVAVAAIFDVNNPDPKIKAFSKNYEAKYGAPPGEGSAVGYQSVYVLEAALAKGDATRKAILKNLSNLGSIDLPLTGKFAFDDFHQPAEVPGGVLGFLLTIQNGEFVAASG